MCDILVRTFQTEVTQICTQKLNNDYPLQVFPNLGFDGTGQHKLSHTDQRKDVFCLSQPVSNHTFDKGYYMLENIVELEQFRISDAWRWQDSYNVSTLVLCFREYAVHFFSLPGEL